MLDTREFCGELRTLAQSAFPSFNTRGSRLRQTRQELRNRMRHLAKNVTYRSQL